ncbi:MAG: hypothetical protein MUE34_14860, partial [Acidimicrobiales bacterium]|nr:hypothetical protein [Acidimicrobiales bacterium]
MARFLWACWDGGGNLTPSLGVARALEDRGHSVSFHGRPDMVGRARASGFDARELTRSYELVDRYAFHPMPTVFGYTSSPAVGEELVTLVAEERPDA